MATEVVIPSVLAFERKLEPSDALLFGGNWINRSSPQDWRPIELREKSVRGTISHRLSGSDNDPANLDAEIRKANPQTVDAASLPANADTLRVQFTLRVLPGTGQPCSCNEDTYRKKLQATVADYAARTSFTELARRYASNLANGRFLWRNRVGAEQVEVTVTQIMGGEAAQSWTFNALDHDMRLLAPRQDANDGERASLDALAALIASGLAGNCLVLLQVTAYARIGAGQEVFPSQEMILDKTSGGKSKTLYATGGVAAMHSQKIGNALRTIDTWYHEAAENGPIAVEPYGSVTTQGKAYRVPKKTCFYSLLDSWIVKDRVPDADQQHFVIATLIRGGLFGKASQ